MGGNESSESVHVVRSPLAGTVVAVPRHAGAVVGESTTVVVIESMKMEHPVPAGTAGHLVEVRVAVGQAVAVGDAVATVDLRVSPHEDHGPETADQGHDLDHVRPDLRALLDRRELTRDSARPDAVTRRHASGHRTARENVADLVEPGSFVEYGSYAVAAQRSRRPLDDLIANTPADGIVTGVGRVGSDPGSDCMVLAYDYTVLAGTQGYFSHKKTDRALTQALERSLPVVFLAEGGGGRAGDVDAMGVVASGLDVGTFALMGRLSGRVPTVAVVTGRCFAGNAAVAGTCDVLIATQDASIAMAGPAMVEGGGLGRFAPEELGPMGVQAPNGVVDVVVPDDAAAIDVARRYLSYFTGARAEWSAGDQRRLRHLVPERRKEPYAVRDVIVTLADEDSVLELRTGFGVGIVTALARVEGVPVGVVANNPAHLGGAIDSDAADKMARFLQLCDAHGLPIVSLCDTPGFMVGPEAERSGTVRHVSRLFVIGANLRVPVATIVLRKAYGLGAQAMAGGGFRETAATVAWPTGEVGAMGLEGAVRLGHAKELAAIADPAERARREEELVEEAYTQGKAINAAMLGELDEVIDPADTRAWIRAALAGAGTSRTEGGHRYVDTW